MKKILAVILVLAMCMSFVACGEVSDIEVDGQSVAVTDFLIEHLGEYIESDAFVQRQQTFKEVTESDPQPLTVTRVIEVQADDLGPDQISVHYLAVKADCQWALGENNLFNNTLLIVDYETGEVYDEFMVDESWMNDPASKDYQTFVMLNGPLVGEGYDGGAILLDSEKRTELSKSDIELINEGIGK